MMVWCALTSGLLLSPRAPPLAPSARRAARSSCVIAYTPPKIEDLSVGQVIPCKVAEVLSDGSYKVDIGSTTLATIPAGEVFLDANASAYANPNASLAVEEDVALPVGGVFEGQVMEMDGEQTKISLAAVSRNLAWKRVVQIQTCDATYLATVLRMGKAGALVNVENLAAFLPWSHWHLSEGSRSEELVGKELAVKILEVDRQRSRLVVSHRRVQLAARLEQLRPGQLINGKISSLRPYGAVVTIADGLDGLLHISQVGARLFFSFRITG